MIGETSATGVRRNISCSTLHPHMPISDSHQTEDGHRVDPPTQTPPPQAVQALSLDFFLTEERIEEALTILRERRRVCQTLTVTPPPVRQADKRKLKDTWVKQITREKGYRHTPTETSAYVFSKIIQQEYACVANSIDLADRFLPRLTSIRKPNIVTFRAYSKDQIFRILEERLKELPYTVFQHQALELCARKVAAACGDMRNALSICRM
ncbi:AAA ATPase [Orobanche gracilis]